MKYTYYIGVHTEEGIIFLTSIDNEKRECYWNKNEKPRKFQTEKYAKSITEGLVFNGFQAVLIKSPTEITKQWLNKTDCPFDI